MADLLGRNLPLALREQAYSPSSLAPDFMRTLAQYSEHSANARVNHGPVETLAYGSAPREKVLLLRAAEQADSVLVFIHGGYWQELSAEDSLFPASSVLAQGLDYAAVGYCLAPEATLEEIVAQVAQALLTLRDTYRAQGTSPRLILAGSSAGAHLAAMMLSRQWGGPPPFHGALLISGIYDLLPLIGTYIDKPLHLTPARARQLSPLHQAPTCCVPVALAWGAIETSVFEQHSLAMADQLHAHLPVKAAVACAGRNHFDILFDLADPATALGEALFTLKKEVTR
jgi:arylformamidase